MTSCRTESLRISLPQRGLIERNTHSTLERLQRFVQVLDLTYTRAYQHDKQIPSDAQGKGLKVNAGKQGRQSLG
jgi:hypothetical protein